MVNLIKTIPSVFFIVAATVLEVCGDAIVRSSIYNHTGAYRIALMLIGALLLFGYGFSLNLAPVAFGKVVGLYIVSLFIVWQVINYVAFRSIPSLPIIVGGTLIITGGLIVNYWQPK